VAVVEDRGRTRIYAPRNQRERLLDGMARTVAQRGYVATAVADVLKAAGISRRTFYEQFDDKRDCFLCAYDEFAALCEARVSAALELADDWHEALARGLEALLGTLAAEPDFARLAIVEIGTAGEPGLARRETALRRCAAFVERGLAHGDEGHRAPTLAAQVVVGGVQELIHTRIVRGDAHLLPSLHDRVLASIQLLTGAPLVH
jgi:AcrR family transcriptional regulator